MTILSEKQKQQVRELFDRNLDKEVTIAFFTQREPSVPMPGPTPLHICGTCAEAEEIMRTLAESSDKLKLNVYDYVADEKMAKQLGVTEIPAIVLIGDKDYGIRYHGVPEGYEFAVILQAIISVSQRAGKLTDATKRSLSQIMEPVNIKIFVTPT